MIVLMLQTLFRRFLDLPAFPRCSIKHLISLVTRVSRASCAGYTGARERLIQNTLSLLATLTSTSLPRGNEGSNQLARFVNPQCLLLLRLWHKEISGLHIHHYY